MGRSVSAARVEKMQDLIDAGQLCCMTGQTGLCCLNKGSVRITERVTDYDEKGNVAAKSGDMVLTYCSRHFVQLCRNILAWEKSGDCVVDRDTEFVTVTVRGSNYVQVQVYHFGTVEEF